MSRMESKLTQEELVTGQPDKKPITMVEIPENLADMTDEEIDAFAQKVWDGWIADEEGE